VDLTYDIRTIAADLVGDADARLPTISTWSMTVCFSMTPNLSRLCWSDAE